MQQSKELKKLSSDYEEKLQMFHHKNHKNYILNI